ncbi:hypothetical protein [Streptomyces sp. NPDC003327]
MSQEAAPERAVPEQQVPQAVPEQQGSGAPKGLLQQMEELMAALSADLSQLDADLQSSADRDEPATHDGPRHEGPQQDGPRDESPRHDDPRHESPRPRHDEPQQDDAEQRRGGGSDVF